MGKGGRKKLRGVEKVEDDEDDADETDDDDRSRPRGRVDDQAYRPRVYKWRMERKK
jgi:U3 small nucleolar RNA-associated protein 11